MIGIKEEFQKQIGEMNYKICNAQNLITNTELKLQNAFDT